MAGSPSFLWLVLVGIIVSTLTTVLIFIIINVCISKQAAKRRAGISQPNYTNSSQDKSNKFPVYTKVEIPPPLPPRDQFLNPESRSDSYEEVDTCVEPRKLAVQNSAPPQAPFMQLPETQTTWLDSKSVSESYDDVEDLGHNGSDSYEEVDTCVELPETQTTWLDSKSVSESYDDVEDFGHNVRRREEDETSVPDYLDLDNDPPAIPSPEFCIIQANSQESLDSYVDVDAVDYVSEDYDDVGQGR